MAKRHLSEIVLLAFGCLFVILVGSGVQACSGTTQTTLKKDVIGCGQPIAMALYTQIPAVFASDDWKAKAESLGIQYGVDFVKCAAKDVLAILTSRSGSGAATAAPEPLVLHLQAYVQGSP